MKDIEMIISREDLEKNRKKHLAADARRRKAKKKETVLNILAVIFFYVVIILGVIGVNARFNQIYNNDCVGGSNEISNIER
jgi:hypothetical protein